MTTNYKDAHIAWLKSTRDFIPKYPGDYSIPYIDVMISLYGGHSGNQIPEAMAEAMFVADMAWYRKSKKIAKEVYKKTMALEPTTPNVWFITLGYDHSVWSIPKVIKLINRVTAMKWIKKCKAQFELHRENGEHPHTHFYIETEYSFKEIKYELTRPKYISELVTKENFIDIKPAHDYHLDYINLIKKPSKMPFVELDNEWREKNGIPIFEKNW